MHRALKILGKVASTVVLLLIVIPLILSVLLEIPAVQNFVVHKAAEIISRKLETTVSIGRVDIGLLNRIKIKEFYVEDYQRDTLLYVGKLDAYISSFGLMGGGLTLSRGNIADAKLYLRETPSGEMNIKQIVSRLENKNKKKTSNFKLNLRAAHLDNFDFCLEKITPNNPEFGIDFGHMHLYDVRATVDDFTIDGSTIFTGISTLSARERSGFVLDHFSGRFYMLSGGLGFEEVSIVTERSNITIPYISLVGNSWAEYKNFIGEVELNGSILHSTVSTDDVAYFAPKLRDWHQTIRNLDVRIEGSVDDFTGRINSLQVGEETSLATELTVKGLPDIKAAHFDLTISHLSSTAKDVEALVRSIARKPLPPNLLGMIGRAGTVDLTARFQGRLSDFNTQMGLTTDLGAVTCNLQMHPQKGGVQGVWGDVRTQNLELGRLLGDPAKFGLLSITAEVDGTVGHAATDARLKGFVSRFGFNGYEYDSLRFDGRVRNKEFDGRITARDPSLRFDFAGQVDLNGEVPYYDFEMDLMHADLHRLHVNRRDTVSILSGHLEAKAGGRSLDDLNGSIVITDALYRYNNKEVEAKQISVLGENSADRKFVELRSDFADVTFRSRTSYRHIVDYLKLSLRKFLPTLDEAKTLSKERALSQTAAANDYSLLSVNIKNINPLTDAMSSGLQIADGSSLQLLFNPASDKLSLKASSEYVERGRMLVTRLNVNADNRGDSLAVYGSAEDFYMGMTHLPNVSVMGGARKGTLQVSMGFRDTVRNTSGLLGVRATLEPTPGPNGRVIDLRILPSHITNGSKTWQIFAHKIELDSTQVIVDRFYMMNRDQDLIINGIASRRLDDSLTLRLRNFDLAPFSQFADRMGYSIEGRTNGEATMKSVLGGGQITADILMDSIRVNGMAAPPLQLESRWDFARSRAGVLVMDRNHRDTLVRGFYDPSQVRYYARVQLDSLNMGLLDPILSGVITDTKGKADIGLVLQGRGRDASIAGQIEVRDFATTVDFTGVTYSMPRAVLEVRGNRFRASNVPIYDPNGNKGNFGIDLNLQHLSNIAYTVRVAPQRMMVLNTTAVDNDLFYGKVFATGTATIAGDKAGVNMNISASTNDNSTFVMPLSGKSNISMADFVTFVKPETRDTTNLVERKKMLFERQKQKESGPGGGMNINLTLDIRPNLDFQLVVDPRTGSSIRGRGEGVLNLDINPRAGVFEMFGDYTIAEGSYNFSLMNLVTRKFIIENGSTIQWTGDPINAMLNIEAIYKVKASLQPLLAGSGIVGGSDRSVPVDCIIRLEDRLTKPSISFDVTVPQADSETQTIIANALSTPESIDTQFLYLLVFNSFYAEASNASGSNIGATASFDAGIGLLTNQLSKLLSADDYNIILRYRPSSEVTNEEVDFGLSKSLINNRLFIELEGNYIIDNKQAVNNNLSNFMGEAYITYLLDKSGALKLKAFTQTIDRFDENQGLQETGIGIYYKEDFNKLKDLRRKFKDRFSGEKRRARRAAREEERRKAAAADTLNRMLHVVKEEQKDNTNK